MSNLLAAGKVLALLSVLAVAGCQTSGNESEFKLASNAGFDEETGAALPPVTQTSATTTKLSRREVADGREGEYDHEAWAAERFTLLPAAPNERPAPGTDEAGLWQLADRYESALKVNAARLTDPQLNTYVSGIVCRVAGPYCNDFRSYLLRIPAFNASMSPNGMMQIFSGFMIRVTSEAELANVIGHEIGHYLLRHGLIGHRRRVDHATGSMIIGIASGVGGVSGVGDLAQLMSAGAYYEHNRDQERQSDGYGYTLMVRAGYDPAEAPEVWDFLTRETEAQGGKDIAYFTRSHPVNKERLEMGRRLAAEIAGAADHELETGRARYLEQILPFRGQFLQDELDQRSYPSFQLLIDKWRDVGVNNGEIEFFQAELFRYRADKEEDDLNSAIHVYKTALELDGAPDQIYRSMGLAYQKLGMVEESHAAFSTYLEIVPEAEDRPLIEMMLQEKTS